MKQAYRLPHLVVTVAETEIARIPRFVAHYRALGVGRIWLTIHTERPDDEVSDARLRAAAEPFLDAEQITVRVLRGSYDAMLIRAHHDDLAGSEVAPDDWILWADIDEFQIYPADLRETLERADRTGAVAVSGELVDRVAPGGRLADMDHGADPWRQYPIGCSLTASIVQGLTCKVVAAKGHVRLTPGNHEPTLSREACRWLPDLVAIHHFKWDATVRARLARRLEPDWKLRCAWWIESARVLDFIARTASVDLSALDIFAFDGGCHRPTDQEAWRFVRGLRARNERWHERWEIAGAAS